MLRNDLVIGKGKLAGKGVYANRDFKKGGYSGSSYVAPTPSSSPAPTVAPTSEPQSPQTPPNTTNQNTPKSNPRY